MPSTLCTKALIKANAVTRPAVPVIAVVVGLLLGLCQQSDATLLFQDNFNTDDTADFNSAPLDGRLSGTLIGNTVLRSNHRQQEIQDQQLLLGSTDKEGEGVRFDQADNLGTFYDWVPDSGADILASGGIRIEFDWTPPDTATTDWTGFALGFDYAVDGTSGIGPSLRVNHAGTDYGIILRGNGDVSRFDNATQTDLDNIGTSLQTRHVQLDFSFDSFADSTTVDALVQVDGSLVDGSSFTWDNNSGKMYMELIGYEANTLVDNFAVSIIPEPASLGLLLLGLGGILTRRRRM